MSTAPPDLDAMRARDRAFGDGESEDASDIAMDRHALLGRCDALQAALSEALDEFEDAIQYKLEYLVTKHGDRETLARLRAIAAGGAPAPAVAADAEQPCPGSRGW